MEYRKYLISKDTVIRDAMQLLGEQMPKILFVAEEDVLLGSLTDGDIRRYLISGGKISDPAYDASNKSPEKIAHSLEEAEGMLSRHYVAIPILDQNGKIKDIYLGSNPGREEKEQIDVPVVINAGGKGTRLEPYTKVLPKPLIPVGDLPIIEHILQRYESFGCHRFALIVNYKKQLIKAYFKESEQEYQIRWFDEQEALGTGGGLSLLKDALKETFFFISCDSLLLSDYSDILKYHRKQGNDITMVCAYKNVTIPYGTIQMNDSGELIGIKEKPEFSFLTNTATYIVEPAVLQDIPENTRIDFPQIIEMEQKKGRKIGVYPISESEWLDMGQMSELEKMRVRLYGE